MKNDETIFIVKLLAFVVGALLVTFPLWWPIMKRDLGAVLEYWK